jgi:hypothetical protein
VRGSSLLRWMSYGQTPPDRVADAALAKFPTFRDAESHCGFVVVILDKREHFKYERVGPHSTVMLTVLTAQGTNRPQAPSIHGRANHVLLLQNAPSRPPSGLTVRCHGQGLEPASTAPRPCLEATCSVASRSRPQRAVTSSAERLSASPNELRVRASVAALQAAHSARPSGGIADDSGGGCPEGRQRIERWRGALLPPHVRREAAWHSTQRGSGAFVVGP